VPGEASEVLGKHMKVEVDEESCLYTDLEVGHQQNDDKTCLMIPGKDIPSIASPSNSTG